MFERVVFECCILHLFECRFNYCTCVQSTVCSVSGRCGLTARSRARTARARAPARGTDPTIMARSVTARSLTRKCVYQPPVRVKVVSFCTISLFLACFIHVLDHNICNAHEFMLFFHLL